MSIKRAKSYRLLRKRLNRNRKNNDCSIFGQTRTALRGLVPDVIGIVLVFILPFEVLLRATAEAIKRTFKHK